MVWSAEYRGEKYLNPEHLQLTHIPINWLSNKQLPRALHNHIEAVQKYAMKLKWFVQVLGSAEQLTTRAIHYSPGDNIVFTYLHEIFQIFLDTEKCRESSCVLRSELQTALK